MQLLDLLYKLEISKRTLEIANSLLDDELYTREDAARDLIIMLQRSGYIQQTLVQEGDDSD
ncbi:hypothetical protein [Gracilibacillus timonensis]|uniref:hypothetical protein n=1 Tax=Gracilibacillus timonensis TaxID=1816696 RepID=UPI000824CF87|nr:hypothetical protein [Gracilibacillus timonensis]